MDIYFSSNHYVADQIKEFGQFLDRYDKSLSRMLGSDELQGRNVVLLDLTSRNEKLAYTRLVETNNTTLNKVVYTFGRLLREIDCLADEVRLVLLKLVALEAEFRAKLLEPGNDESSSLLLISDNMELLTTVKCYMERINEVAVAFVRQIGALLELECKRSAETSSKDGFELDVILDYLGKLLFLSVQFDCFLAKSALKVHWKAFLKQVTKLKKETQPGSSAEFLQQLHDLINVCNGINVWFEETSYKLVSEALCRAKSEFTIEASGALSEALVKYMKQHLPEAVAAASTVTSSTFVPLNQHDTVAVMTLNIFVNLSASFFIAIDNKTLKQLTEVNLKFCFIPFMGGSFYWTPDWFVSEQGHKVVRDYDGSTDYHHARDGYCQLLLSKALNSASYCLQTSRWLTRMHITFRTTKNDFNMETLRRKCTLLFDGLRCGREMVLLVEAVIGFRRALMQISIESAHLPKITKLLECIQLVVRFFLDNQTVIVETHQFIVQQLQHKIFSVYNSVKKQILKEAKQSKQTKAGGGLLLQKLSIIDVIEKCLCGPATPDRLCLTKLMMSISSSRHILSADSYQRVKTIHDQIELLSNVQLEVQQIYHSLVVAMYQLSFDRRFFPERDSTDNDFQFAVAPPAVPPLLSYTRYDAPDQTREQRALLQSLLHSTRRLNERGMASHGTFINELCNRIESFLRVDYHEKHQQIPPIDPFAESQTPGTVGVIVVPSKAVGTTRGSIERQKIEQYLNNVYYTLASISQQDWKIYKEMRCMASRQYGIQNVDDQLPRQDSAEHDNNGCDDVLEIMHNIERFIGNYAYSLHFQLFIEASTGSRAPGTMHVLKIGHIASSLKRHGCGVVNTVVNFAFQFLRQKLFAFSYFLYDEQIKARLASDAKHFHESTTGDDHSQQQQQQQSQQMYSYDRARAFLRKIRALGCSDDGETYLDLFRQLICHIGNTMAFIRMLRAGALRESTANSEFLSRLADPSGGGDRHDFLQLLLQGDSGGASAEMNRGGATSGGPLEAAAAVLEDDMRSMSWWQGTRQENNFFRLLVNVFADFRRSENSRHLENFHLIIPPLTINYVEHILKAKERLVKKDHRHDGAHRFTDDGFAMGLAYLLQLLHQTTPFNSLHWFKAVKQKYVQEVEKLDHQQQQQQPQQTVALTRKRLAAVQKEFDLLYYNLCSSKIFFNDL